MFDRKKITKKIMTALAFLPVFRFSSLLFALFYRSRLLTLLLRAEDKRTRVEDGNRGTSEGATLYEKASLMFNLLLGNNNNHDNNRGSGSNANDDGNDNDNTGNNRDDTRPVRKTNSI